MSKKKLAAAPDVERVDGMNDREEALADLEPEARDLHKGDGAADLENEVQHLRVLVAEKQEQNDALVEQLAECQRAFDDPDRKQSRRKQEKRDPLGVHDFWDGYEQALKDVAYRADGTEYVGRDGRTLSQALHTADVRRKAQLAEAEADRAAGK